MSAGPARRLEPDARREQILECAVRLFGERPYPAVSTVELAAEAGVTRGLIHHYFGTKRGLYLAVVRRMLAMTTPDDAGGAPDAAAPLEERVERSVRAFLDSVAEHGRTFVAVTGAEGVGDDPEVERLLAEADDRGARRVLETLGVAVDAGPQSRERAMIRAYAGLVKGAVREWIRAGTLTREEVHLLLSRSLVTIVRDVL